MTEPEKLQVDILVRVGRERYDSLRAEETFAVVGTTDSICAIMSGTEAVGIAVNAAFRKALARHLELQAEEEAKDAED